MILKRFNGFATASYVAACHSRKANAIIEFRTSQLLRQHVHLVLQLRDNLDWEEHEITTRSVSKGPNDGEVPRLRVLKLRVLVARRATCKLPGT